MQYGALSREGSSLSFLGKTKRHLRTCLDDVADNSIQEFVVEEDSFTDRYLDILFERQTPASIILRLTQVSGFGVNKIVENCRSVLQRLSLFGSNCIERDGIKRLSECGKLLSLDVGYTGLDGYDLKYLAKKLSELNISGLELTYDELDIVCEYRDLRYLRAEHLESCSEALFVTLSSLPDLRYLYLDRCEIEDVDLISPGNYQSLRTLSLGNNELTTLGVANLTEIASLTSLRLNGNFKIGRDDSYLSLPRGLVELELDSCNLSDKAISKILRCSRLKTLSLSNNLDLTHRGLAKLGSLQRLANLCLSGIYLTDLDFAAIERCKGLELLDLEHTNLEGGDLYRLARMKNLKQLMIRGTPAALDAIAIKDLSKRFIFPNLG